MTKDINLKDLEKTINTAWDSNDNSSEFVNAVNLVISLLDDGFLRVADKVNDNWEVNQWIKKAVLLSFKYTKNKD